MFRLEDCGEITIVVGDDDFLKWMMVPQLCNRDRWKRMGTADRQNEDLGIRAVLPLLPQFSDPVPVEVYRSCGQ